MKGKEEASPSEVANQCNKQEAALKDANESRLQASQVRPIFIHRGEANISTGNTSNSLLFSKRGDSSVRPILPSSLAQVETSMGNNILLAPAPVDTIGIKPSAVLSNRTKQGVHACQDSSESQSSNQRDAEIPIETPYQQLAPATSSSGEESESSSKKREKPKKDRSELRKGKWTVEEEEYTSRIIHHFSTGLLTLPEGTTLRSYLAEKLTCDPMRITKKFAGASCLGKRVYHLCDRSQATATEIEMAKQELGGLEHRFRLRVDHGQSGVPLPVNNVIPATSTVGYAVQQVAAPTWFATMPPNGLPLAQNHALPQTGAPHVWPFSIPPAPLHFSIAPQQMAPPMNGQVHAGTPAPANLPIHAGQITMSAMPIPMPAPPHPSHMNKAANDAITSWAWAQAAASLTPALSQLAAANFQQHQQQQLQKAYESQLQSFAHQHQQQQIPLPTSHVASSQPASNTMAPPAPLQPMFTMTVGGPIASLPPTLPLVVSASPVAPQPVTVPPPVVNAPTEAQTTSISSPSRKERTKEDEDAGSMLMGFLSSLREGFIEAVNQKDKEEQERSLKRPSPAADLSTTDVSSGTTSQAAESSMEDSGSDKGKEGSSSSEDSDKDTPVDRPLGPPRKRMMMKKVSEFTSQNVAKHNRAMTALHGSNQNGFNQQHIPGRLEDPKQRKN